LVEVAKGLGFSLVSAEGYIEDEGGMVTGHLNSQLMIVLQKNDRANISKREGGKIVKNETIVENNMRIQRITMKLT
jgi:hypothetical protein